MSQKEMAFFQLLEIDLLPLVNFFAAGCSWVEGAAVLAVGLKVMQLGRRLG